jgi:hypothetical protein
LNAASHPPENKLKKKYFPKNDNFVERRKSRKLLLFLSCVDDFKRCR